MVWSFGSLAVILFAMVGVLILKELELGCNLTREIAWICNLVELFGLAGCSNGVADF
ncbi:hypothetical protein RDI58_010781 [Solanum bulbocastanum]|uniref:Uncharacterized protein n=1 Tax=Solanum bulbocastanum TaxID=147425 RepID=A0AAN8TR70_SOLBU